MKITFEHWKEVSDEIAEHGVRRADRVTMDDGTVAYSVVVATQAYVLPEELAREFYGARLLPEELHRKLVRMGFRA